VNWWAWGDAMLLLVFGGIPWHVYFQRVLAARDEATARQLSVLAALACLVAAIPPVLIGVLATGADWAALGLAAPDATLVLPYVLRHLTPPLVAAIGLDDGATKDSLQPVGWVLIAGGRAGWRAPVLRLAALVVAASLVSRLSAWGPLAYLAVPVAVWAEASGRVEFAAAGLAWPTVRAAALGLAGGAFLGIYPGLDFEVLPVAFAVVIIGGMGSLAGAAIGSMLVGLADNFGKALFPEIAYFSLYAPMVLILAMKPTGLLGRE